MNCNRLCESKTPKIDLPKNFINRTSSDIKTVFIHTVHRGQLKSLHGIN